jgi:hypothetical protein
MRRSIVFTLVMTLLPALAALGLYLQGVPNAAAAYKECTDAFKLCVHYCKGSGKCELGCFEKLDICEKVELEGTKASRKNLKNLPTLRPEQRATRPALQPGLLQGSSGFSTTGPAATGAPLAAPAAPAGQLR